MSNIKPLQQTIDFYGDELITIQEPDTARVYLPLGRMCDNLTVDRSHQLDRAQKHSVLQSGLKTFRIQTAGGEQEVQCLRLDLVPFWLAGLNPNRIKDPATRAKLELYQREVAAVLWDMFRPAGQPSSVALQRGGTLSLAEQAYETAMALAALARQQMTLEARFEVMAEQAEAQQQRLEALEVQLAPKETISEEQASELSQAVKTLAYELSERTGRNEFGGIYGQLYREFGITSYKSLPRDQFDSAMAWLREWYRAMLRGTHTPPPRQPA